MDVADLCEKLRHSDYEFRRQSIDQVKSRTRKQEPCAVFSCNERLYDAELPQELIELLQNAALFCFYLKLQSVIFADTALTADLSKS